jgi:hypothetical protein
VVNVGVRDATYVLDGLLYHESDLHIEEHYTDTAGFTDHVFALMHLLGFRFAPRLRDLGETRLYVPKQSPAYTTLKPMIGGTLQIKSIHAHWDEILRLATSIKQGTVTASLMLRKLGSYPRQNGLAVALRELGRIERTLFICCTRSQESTLGFAGRSWPSSLVSSCRNASQPWLAPPATSAARTPAPACCASSVQNKQMSWSLALRDGHPTSACA